MIKALLLGHLTWNIPLLIFLSVITIGYLIGVFRNEPISFFQPSLFILGMSLLYFSIGSPLLAISYLSFSFHMIQMSILYFIIPPLILLGLPAPIYKRLLNLPLIHHLNHSRYSPRWSLILFAIFFLFYHFPLFLVYISEHSIIQNGFLTVLFILSLHMWVPIASPHSKRKLSEFKRSKYVFQSGLFIMPACLLFIISALFDGSNNPLFSQMITHLCLPPDSNSIQLLPPPFNTKYDQMMAGIFMMGLHKLGLIVTCKLETKCANFTQRKNKGSLL